MNVDEHHHCGWGGGRCTSPALNANEEQERRSVPTHSSKTNFTNNITKRLGDKFVQQTLTALELFFCTFMLIPVEFSTITVPQTNNNKKKKNQSNVCLTWHVLQNLVHLFYTSIWERAHGKHLERGGPLKKFGRVIGWSCYLSHSISIIQVSLLQVEPAGDSTRFPTDMRGKTWHVSQPSGELWCVTLFS